MQVFLHRRAIIEWAGQQGAFPVQKIDAPDEVKLSRPGGDEAGWRRVGWEPFFRALARRRALVVVDDSGCRILPREEALRELPPEAFGPPWWQALWHDIWLTRPEPK